MVKFDISYKRNMPNILLHTQLNININVTKSQIEYGKLKVNFIIINYKTAQVIQKVLGK